MSINTMLFLVQQRALAGDRLEVLVETGEIIETALIAQLLDADPVVEEQFTGMAHPDLSEELGEGLTGPRLKITAKGIGHQSGDGRDLFQIDLPGKMAKGKVIDGVDPVVLAF